MGRHKSGQSGQSKVPKRKRHPSSPGVRQNPVLKRNKLVLSSDPSDSDGEVTYYFDAVDSDQDSCDTPPTTMEFSADDLASLSTQLAPLLIKELKNPLKRNV